MSVRVGRVSVEGVDFRSFIWLFTRAIEQDEVDHTGNRVGAVNRRGAVFQDFRATQSTDPDGVDVGIFKGPATIDKGQGIFWPRARRLINAWPLPPFESFSVAALPTKEGN